jgi:hypothetical protein
MTAPILVKSLCLLLFTKKLVSCMKCNSLILGISYTILQMMEPYLLIFGIKNWF